MQVMSMHMWDDTNINVLGEAFTPQPRHTLEEALESHHHAS